LSEKAKEKALDEFRGDAFFSQLAWEDTQEDAKQIGLELTGVDRGYMTGDFIVSAEDCMEKILKEHGKVCETYKTVKYYQKELKKAKNDDDIADIKDEFKKSILEDYRIIAEKNEEYAYSDENLTEVIEMNDYNFLENGELD